MSLFDYRDYRYLFAAQVVSLFGTGLTTIALGLLAYQFAGADAGSRRECRLLAQSNSTAILGRGDGEVVDRHA